MRKLYLRDRSTDIQGTTVIRDQDGKSCYLLVGKTGIRHDALSVYAIDGALLAEAKQLSLGVLPKFALYVNRQRVGTIRKVLNLTQQVIYIRGIRWIVVGSPLTNRYRVFHGSRLIFSIQPVELSSGYCHELAISKEGDEPLAILIASILNRWARRSDREPFFARLFKNKSALNPCMPYSLTQQPTISAKKLPQKK